MPRVLVLATTTGYQTRAFGDAAERLGVELVFATDRCNMLEDPWQDAAIPIRFHEEEQSAEAIVAAAALRPIDGLIVVGNRPTLIGAYVAAALGLPWHPPEAAVVARHKQFTRERLREHGLSVPWFLATSVERDPHEIKDTLSYPCVVKPVALSGSRGVMRANTPDELVAAFFRLRALVRSADIRAERNHAHDMALVEGFIPGREFALEGLLNQGHLTVLALFDKPDPLDGPFFEETIYLTPSSAPPATHDAIADAVARAATAIGLWHGPIHAECRVNAEGVFVLEVAARPIGGLCARALRFKRGRESFPASDLMSLEELLLRHSLGESPEEWGRESLASGVMMIPIPQRGVFRRVDGLEEARRAVGIHDIRITAKTDQVLVPLPEGASYLGFIFAAGDAAADVDAALRAAHARLTFVIDPDLPISRGRPDPLQSHHG